MDDAQVEHYVLIYGELYRCLITTALAFLREQEAFWGLDTPIDRDRYISDLIANSQVEL